MKSKTFTFTLNPDLLGEMDRLVRETGSTDFAALVSEALTLMEWAVSERVIGREISSYDRTSGSHEICRMKAIENARRVPPPRLRIVEAEGSIPAA